MNPKFNLIGIRTHDLKTMDSTFHVPETLALTTEPPGTSIAKPVDSEDFINQLVAASEHSVQEDVTVKNSRQQKYTTHCFIY